MKLFVLKENPLVPFNQKALFFKVFKVIVFARKTLPLNGQTREAKSPSQPVSLPSDWPLMKPLISVGEIGQLH